MSIWTQSLVEEVGGLELILLCFNIPAHISCTKAPSKSEMTVSVTVPCISCVPQTAKLCLIQDVAPDCSRKALTSCFVNTDSVCGDLDIWELKHGLTLQK